MDFGNALNELKAGDKIWALEGYLLREKLGGGMNKESANV